MTCVKCKSQMSQPKLLNMTGKFKSETLSVAIEGVECEGCGNQILEGRRMGEFMQKLGDAYRVKRGLLTSAQIRSQRERLGMSQADFATYLGVGVAGVKRWELGDIQTKTVDELIRSKTDPDYIETLLNNLYRRLAVNRTESRAVERSNGVLTTCEQLAA